MYICVFMYLFIMENAFRKHDLGTWHLYCKLNFWIDVYNVFEKSSSNVTLFYRKLIAIDIYIYTNVTFVP